MAKFKSKKSMSLCTAWRNVSVHSFCFPNARMTDIPLKEDFARAKIGAPVDYASLSDSLIAGFM